MKFLIVALMALTHLNGDRSIFVFTHQKFDSANECVQHVQQNQQSLMFKLIAEFPDDRLDRILCVPEENVKEILELSQPINDEGREI